MQGPYWIGAGALIALALAASWADQRRSKRHDPDAVGWVPWSLLQVLAFIGAMACAIIAFHR